MSIDKKFIDNGFILFSGYDLALGSSVTSLFSLQEKKIIQKISQDKYH